MFKRFFVLILLIVVGIVVLVGCGKEIKRDDFSGYTPGEIEGEGKLGDAYIKIVSATKSTDVLGRPAILITYEFTNMGGIPKSFDMMLSGVVYQNGVECEKGLGVEGRILNMEEGVKKDKPYEVAEGYILKNETDPVRVEVTMLIDQDNKTRIVSKTFEI